MVTEAIPTRVFSLYKIAVSKKDITRAEAQAMMEPPEIYKGTSYFQAIFKAASELKVIDLQDGVVVPLISKTEMKDIADFRQYVISQLNTFENEPFFRVTNIIVNMNAEILKFTLTDNELLNEISQKMDIQITAPMMRGWRFWAQFLGFGYIDNMHFLPNAYIFAKNVLKLMELEKKMEYEMDDFMLKFGSYGKIISSNMQPESNINIALSSALRELHDNKEIELNYRSDAKKRWVLYPSMEQFNEQVASIIYKGVKQ